MMKLATHFILLCIFIIQAGCGANSTASINKCLENCEAPQSLVVDTPVINFSKAKLSGGFFDNFEAIGYDEKQNILNLKLPLSGNVSFSDGSDPLSLSKETFAKMIDLDSQNPFLDMHINLNEMDLLKRGKIIDGFPHPKFPAQMNESLYATELNVSTDPDLNAWLFLGKSSITIFIESAMNPYVLHQFMIKGLDDKIVGRFIQLPHTEEVRGGYVLIFYFSPQSE